MNPIPQENLEKFKTIFFEENAIQLNNITNLLSLDQLTENQQQLACSQLDHIIQKISETIENTCCTTPIPTLTNRASQQGDFLPRKLQKLWKKHIKTYHLIIKAIYITNNTINWCNHPIMYELNSHTHINIPPPPNDDLLKNDWIKELATLAKIVNIQERKITTKYTKECIKKTIFKYRQVYEINLKKINKKVFKNLVIPPLDCITNRNNYILTNLEDIANEIHIQQSISNRLTIPTCHFLPNHASQCTCGVRQYPWHDIDGFIIDKCGNPQTPLHTYLDQETYNLCLKNLANNKISGPDKIPNSILKNMPASFHHILFLFFIHCYKLKQIPTS